jgi:hypothetical protein
MTAGLVVFVLLARSGRDYGAGEMAPVAGE